MDKSINIATMEGSNNELPEKLAEMEIAEEETGAPPATEMRVLRERRAPGERRAAPEPARKRRTSAAPRKRCTGDIERLYLNKMTKLSPRALETIAEEGGCGGRKLRRHIRFATAGRAVADKAKKRRARIKKLLGDGFLSRNKMSMQAFLCSLHALEQDPPASPHAPPHMHVQTISLS